MKNLDKKYTERIHAKRRFKQRFGKELNRFELKEIVKNIQKNKYQFIEKQSRRVSLFLANIKDCDTIVAYDKRRRNIITFLEVKNS